MIALFSLFMQHFVALAAPLTTCSDENPFGCSASNGATASNATASAGQSNIEIKVDENTPSAVMLPEVTVVAQRTQQRAIPQLKVEPLPTTVNIRVPAQQQLTEEQIEKIREKQRSDREEAKKEQEQQENEEQQEQISEIADYDDKNTVLDNDFIKQFDNITSAYEKTIKKLKPECKENNNK